MEILYLGGRLMTEQLFKALNKDGAAFHGGAGTWHLPSDGTPGEWMPPIEGKLIACQNGYHLCRAEDLLTWLGPAIFEAEYRGERLDAKDKVVVHEARLLRQLNWDDRAARLFACDCAERVLAVFEEQRPNDGRPRRAIETARRYADGKVTSKELRAAGDAAWAAADAVRAAAKAAVWDAAWDAAWTTAGDAAKAAGWDAE